MGKWMRTINDYRKQTIKEDSKCIYFGSKENLTIDHIIPLTVLAMMSIDKFSAFAYDKNFGIACLQCNRDKRANR
jgi:5-methylcytosine-specific restriction endonuclease McrA